MWQDIARSMGLLSRGAAEMVIGYCEAAIPQHLGRHSREGGNLSAQRDCSTLPRLILNHGV